MTGIAILQFSLVPVYFYCGWVKSPIWKSFSREGSITQSSPSTFQPSLNPHHCLFNKFLQRFIFWGCCHSQSYLSPRPHNPLHQCLPNPPSHSLCEKDWCLADFCPGGSFYRGSSPLLDGPTQVQWWQGN